jgi:hypothetical protein
MEAVIRSVLSACRTRISARDALFGRCVHTNHFRCPCSEANAAQTFGLFPAVVIHHPLAAAYRMVSSVRSALARSYWVWFRPSFQPKVAQAFFHANVMHIGMNMMSYHSDDIEKVRSADKSWRGL